MRLAASSSLGQFGTGIDNRAMQGTIATSRRPAPPGSTGFTLIEVMITVAIVSILAMVAFPTFMDGFRKGRRAEAFAALSAVQLAQERWRANSPTYADNLSNAPTATPPGLNLPATSTPSGYYAISLSGVGADGYTALATAVSSTSQAKDTRCKVLGARMAGGNILRGSGESSIDWAAANPDSGSCWAR